MTSHKLIEAAAEILLIAFLFTNCEKEFSYEGGTAEFSLLNTNGSCTNPVIAGNYVRGSALGSSNTVQLQAYVTAAGRFSLQTDSRSGFLFTATGSFSDTGIQTITLVATGKPDSAGDFIFTPELEAGCSFGIHVTDQLSQQNGYTITGAPNTCSNVKVSRRLYNQHGYRKWNQFLRCGSFHPDRKSNRNPDRFRYTYSSQGSSI